MPSSGYGLANVPTEHCEDFLKSLARASKWRMEYEWLSSFVAAIRAGASVEEASWAGVVEWDL